MKRAAERARQGLGTAALLVLLGLALWGAGSGVAAVWHAAADRIGGAR